MMGKKKYHYSLFGRFVSLTFLIFVSIILSITWRIRETHQKVLNDNLVNITSNINQSIASNFKDIEYKLRFFAYVLTTFREGEKYDTNGLIKWFSSGYNQIDEQWVPIIWLDKSNTIIHKDSEIFQNLTSVEIKKYINNMEKASLSLEFITANSDYTGEHIIPAFMKIENPKGIDLGHLVTGIYLDKLHDLISSQIDKKHKEIFYVLVNTVDNKIILNSDKFDLEYTNTLLNNITTILAEEEQDTALYVDKYKNYTISKISNYPFAIVLGINQQTLSLQDYIDGILPYKYHLFFLSLLVCGLVYLFYISILKPFLLLSEAALQISEGDLNTEIPRIYSKEGSTVAHALERIKDSLRVEKNLVLEVSNTHNLLSLTNLRLENQVLERTQELESSLAEKTAFLNNLSHEIKTPLQAVTNIAENLFSHWKEFSEDKKLEFVNQVIHGSKSLLLLLCNLLELAKFSESKIALNVENIDLIAITKEVVAECNTLHDHHKALSFNIVNENPVYVTADKSRLKQVLRNLIVNAIRFSPFKGSIAINIIQTKIYTEDGTRHDAVHFAIHDQGVGIPAEELSNIFSPFIQGSNIKNKSTGTGLGLAICKDIINIHHGKIWAANNKDGGATFNFIIPVVQPYNLTTYTPGNLSLNKIEPNILVVDDEEICLNSMEMMLYGSRYNLIKIKSANFALKYLKEYGHMISVIFIDLMMPDMYGLNFLSEIKNNLKLSAPIILQTSSSDEEELIKAVDIGVLSFIRKPYNKKVLLNEIEKAMHFSRINLELH